jgi:hypothetical protein
MSAVAQSVPAASGPKRIEIVPFVLLLSALLLLVLVTFAQQAMIDELRGSAGKAFARGFLAGCSSPCVIRDNPGGRVSDYQALAKEVLASGHLVGIAGYCASACALFADLARPNVVIAGSTRFKFHKTSGESLPPVSPDIDAWVKAHGG